MACELHHSKARFAEWSARKEADHVVLSKGMARARSSASPFHVATEASSRGSRQSGRSTGVVPSRGASVERGGQSDTDRVSKESLRKMELEVARCTAEVERLAVEADQVRAELREMARSGQVVATENELVRHGLAQELQGSLRTRALLQDELRELDVANAQLVRRCEAFEAERAAASTSAHMELQAQASLRQRFAHEVEVCAQLQDELTTKKVQLQIITAEASAAGYAVGALETERLRLSQCRQHRRHIEHCLDKARSQYDRKLARRTWTSFCQWQVEERYNNQSRRAFSRGMCHSTGHWRAAVVALLCSVFAGWQRAAQNPAVIWPAEVVRSATRANFAARMRYAAHLVSSLFQIWFRLAMQSESERNSVALYYFRRRVILTWCSVARLYRGQRWWVEDRLASCARGLLRLSVRAWRAHFFQQRLLRRNWQRASFVARRCSLRQGLFQLAQTSRAVRVARRGWWVMTTTMRARNLRRRHILVWWLLTRKRKNMLKTAIRSLQRMLASSASQYSLQATYKSWHVVTAAASQRLQSVLATHVGSWRVQMFRRAAASLRTNAVRRRTLRMATACAHLLRMRKAVRDWSNKAQTLRQSKKLNSVAFQSSFYRSLSFLRKCFCAWLRRQNLLRRQHFRCNTFARRVRLERCHTVFRSWTCVLLGRANLENVKLRLDEVRRRCREMEGMLNSSRQEAIKTCAEKDRLAANLLESQADVKKLSSSVKASQEQVRMWQAAFDDEALVALAEAGMVSELRDDLTKLVDEGGLGGLDVDVNSVPAHDDSEQAAGDIRGLARELAETQKLEASLQAAIQRCADRHAACSSATAVAHKRCGIFRAQLAFAGHQHAAALSTLAAELGRLREECNQAALAEETLRHELHQFAVGVARVGREQPHSASNALLEDHHAVEAGVFAQPKVAGSIPVRIHRYGTMGG